MASLNYKTFFDGKPTDPTDLELLGPRVTDKLVASAEKKLGYTLPTSYIELLKIRNGGYLAKTRFPTKKVPSWASDHVAFDVVSGIGGEESIDGETGSAYLIKEWGYPDVGIVISSDGHTAFMLDYRESGPKGEPRVLWVDAENPKANVVLADTFEDFLNKLEE
jgi:hypothetical protein